MIESKSVRCFFSYAHDDEKSDPELIEFLAKKLETRVRARLTNVDFKIWRDNTGLRAGELWSDTIDEEIKDSDIFILLLSPRWVSSDRCVREYRLFESVERAREIGSCAIPILVRSTTEQAKYFTNDQKAVYDRILRRQYQRAIATEFLTMGVSEREVLVDEIADDVAGMVDRIRASPTGRGHCSYPALQPVKEAAKQYRLIAHDYGVIDPVSSFEVVLALTEFGKASDVYAQVDFVEIMFIETPNARIEFSVRRAYLTIINRGTGSLSIAEHIKSGRARPSVYGVKLHDGENSISLCIEPSRMGGWLAELTLPPAPDQNYLSHIATVSGGMLASSLVAELTLLIGPDGLHVHGGGRDQMSRSNRKKIEAIMGVAISKGDSPQKSRLMHRVVSVKERAL